MQLGMEELIGIIKHELCHYHLHLEGKGYQASEIRILKSLLKKLVAPRYCTPLPETSVKRKQNRILTYIMIECSDVL